MTGWIVIPRWDEFQHRDMARSSVPPWIKAYTKLMSDDDFLKLTFRQRGILLSIWLEYARARRVLGSSAAGLGQRLGDQTVRQRDLDALSHAGFIEVSASKPAGAHASNVAGLEVEVEKKVLSFAHKPKPQNDRVPFNTPPTTPRINAPAYDTERYVRALISNGVITEPFELDDFDLNDLIRLELKEQLRLNAG